MTDPRHRRAEQIRALVEQHLVKGPITAKELWWAVKRRPMPGSYIRAAEVMSALQALRREGRARSRRPFWELVEAA